jgi:Domain of Unknown Function with PDB structure (DUF3857)
LELNNQHLTEEGTTQKMNRTTGRRLLCASLFASLLSLAAPLVHADQWTTPTHEELSMTLQPEVPGAPAVYLYREEKTEDDLHMFSIYVRLKVLTEKGKEYANVELPYAAGEGGISISDIAGRTIHPDGTIIPFTGKPYDKLVEKTRDMRYMSKIFTLPDVEVGSIIEYSYKRRLEDNYFMSPSWFVQTKLFTRKAHYIWKPTAKQLVSSDDRGQLTSSVAWFPVLPASAEFKNIRMPPVGFNEGQLIFELNIHDVPPAPDEEYMPPMSSLTFRVLFYYSPYRTGDEYWKSEGKHWAKLTDKFIGSGPAVHAAVQELTTPTDTQDQKLRKLYAAVMKLENTDFTREHTNSEEKSQGLKEIHNADDILIRKRGSGDQLTELFVSMARVAGMKAYVALIASRDRNIFIPAYLSFRQFDDYIAIVNVDGKEQYFDPGSRFCPYQQLAWKHTMVGGVRQAEGGSAIITTPAKPYTASRVQRVANLTMNEQGVATGTVSMTFIGDPAISWRQTSAAGDASSLERELHDSVEHLLPQGMDVKVSAIEKLDDYESPLTVTFSVKGPIGSSTGKRLLFAGDIFETNSKPTFPHEKRETTVYFHYPYFNQDAVRVNFPPVFSVESLPAGMKQQFQTYALYALAAESTPTSVTVRRNYTLGEILFMPKEYPDLRAFYNKIETKDQESVVLTVASTTAKSTTAAVN